MARYVLYNSKPFGLLPKAYPQEHSKMSFRAAQKNLSGPKSLAAHADNLTSKVGRLNFVCFVEKPIKQTRNLVTGKEIQYSGMLYSEEYKCNFTAKNITAQVKRNSTSKQLVLHIGGTLIGKWFIEQFNKLRHTVRLRNRL